jgi:hypothetical protein
MKQNTPFVDKKLRVMDAEGVIFWGGAFNVKNFVGVFGCNSNLHISFCFDRGKTFIS